MDTTVYIAFVVVIAILTIGLLCVPFLRRTDRLDIEDIKLTKEMLELASKIVKEVKPNDAFSNTAAKTALEAVRYAEQMYLLHTDNVVDRKLLAVDFAIEVLTDAGFDMTPNRIGILDGLIEAAVYVLPKTHPVEQD